MGDHKPENNNPTIFASSVRHWLHSCPYPSHGAPNSCPSFSLNESGLSLDDQYRHQHKDQAYPHLHPHQHHDQQQQKKHAQSVEPYSPYSHILDDSDKAIMATIQLSLGSADRAFSSQTTNNTITTAANTQQISMCNIPAMLPGMENSYHPSTDWESKQKQHHLQLPDPIGGHRSPFVRHLTPMTELDSASSSGHSSNGSADSPHLLSSCVSDNHNHRYQNHQGHHAIYNADNSSSSNPTVILPDQGTPLPHHPSAVTHNHHQYGAVDGISAAFLHLTHLYHPLSQSPLASASSPPFPNSPCSPSNTPFSSSYLQSSLSPSSPLTYSSPYHPNSFGINSDPVTFGGPDESTFLDGHRCGMYAPLWSHSRPLVTRSTPVMSHCNSQALLEKQCLSTSSPSLSVSLVVPQSYIVTRRRSQALLAQNSLLSLSKRTTGPSMVAKPKPLPFSRLSTPNTSLTAAAGGARSSSSITSPSSPLNPTGSLPRATTSSPRPSSSSRYNPLICEICRKEYANNSTLRRHAKIHAYASASSDARKITKPSPAMSSSLDHGGGGYPASGFHSDGVSAMSTLEAVNTHLLSSFWPYRDNLTSTLPRSLMTTSSTNTSLISASSDGGSSSSMIANAITTPGQVLQVATTAAAITMLPGYNPGYDPAIKKPECAGCNKPFARRDTVILHIKNQKRNWDLMCAMLPELAALAESDSSTSTYAGAHCGGDAEAGGDSSDGEGDGDDDGDDDDADSSNRRTSSGAKVSGGRVGTTATQRRSVRQKRVHPFRAAEKLWHSTLQKNKIHFGPYKKTPSVVTATVTTTTVKRAPSVAGSRSHSCTSRPSSSFGYNGMYVDDQFPRQHQRQIGGDMEMMNAYVETDSNEDENEGMDEGGWPSEDTLESMDNATKIQLMMKMAVVPPCWSERKVRIFGVQGTVEETVLQD